jgi:glycosyltransferase involved in cell wall biosynthesis
MRPPKVLVISSQFTPTIGGGGAHTYYLVNQLCNSKTANVRVLTSHVPGLLWHEKIKNGLVIHRADFKHTESLIYESAIVKGLEICETFRPDIIHGQHIDGALVGLHLKSSYNIPLVVTIHKTPLLRFDESIPKRFPIYSFLKLLASMNYVDSFIAGSKVFKRESKAFGVPEDKMQFIYHGIPYKLYQSLAYNDIRIATLKNKLGLGEKDRLILCPSRLDERKGLPVLVKAVVEVQKKFPTQVFKILITGEAHKPTEHQLKQDLERIAAEGKIGGNLQFCTVPIEDMPSLFAVSDVCVLPARKEGLGLVLLEAMAIRCPVVASNSPGIDEVITSEDDGLLFEPDDDADLARQLTRLFGNAELMKKVKANGLKTVVKRFSASRMADDHVRLYSSLLKPKVYETA